MTLDPAVCGSPLDVQNAGSMCWGTRMCSRARTRLLASKRARAQRVGLCVTAADQWRAAAMPQDWENSNYVTP